MSVASLFLAWSKSGNDGCELVLNLSQSSGSVSSVNNVASSLMDPTKTGRTKVPRIR